jgi:hypothetical protein
MSGVYIMVETSRNHRRGRFGGWLTSDRLKRRQDPKVLVDAYQTHAKPSDISVVPVIANAYRLSTLYTGSIAVPRSHAFMKGCQYVTRHRTAKVLLHETRSLAGEALE